MEQNERHANQVVVKTDEDYDIDMDDDVVIVLAVSSTCSSDEEDADEPVELTLPCRPHDGQSVRLIAAGQAFTLDGGDFVVGNCDDDDDDDDAQDDAADRVFPIGSAVDVVFADLSFNNCNGCGHCGCSKKSKCDCPKGRWFVVGEIAPAPVPAA